MEDNKIQLSPDTWVYVDEKRKKIVVEMNFPQEESSAKMSADPFPLPESIRN